MQIRSLNTNCEEVIQTNNADEMRIFGTGHTRVLCFTNLKNIPTRVNTDIATIPEGHRPLNRFYTTVVAPGSTGMQAVVRLQVKEDGVITAYNYSSITGDLNATDFAAYTIS